MKKAIYIILAAAALASCSKNEVIDTVGREVISFGDVFVDHSTRAVTHTTASLDEFFVYGSVTGNVEDENGNKGKVNIYKGDRVYKDNGIWNCDAIQYWVPECGYDFVAVSDVDATDPSSGEYGVTVRTSDGLPAFIDYDAECQKDLLYATETVTTDASAVPSTGLDDGHINPVAFTFDHLLSKVQFTFTNDFRQDSGVQLAVTDIRIKNAPKTGTYTIDGTPEWTVNSSFTGTGNDYLSFGSTEAIDAGGKKGTSSTQCVLIPCKQAFNITFTVEHNKGGTPTQKTITTEEITLEKGHFYNFTAALNSGNVEGVVPITINVVTSDTWGVQEDEQVGPVYPESN